jgi:hypothetical protein
MKYRPAGITQWMKKADHNYSSIPIDIPLVQWQLWWMENQSSQQGPEWPPRRNDAEAVDWAGFKTSKNGIFTLIVTLARIAQFVPRTTAALKDAVVEVYYSLIMAASLPWSAPTMSETGNKCNNAGSSCNPHSTKYTPSICIDDLG